LLAAVRAASGTGLLLAAPIAEPLGWPARGAVAIVGGALLLPALRALLPRGTLRARPGLPSALATRGLLSFAFFGTEAFVPLGANTLRGATPARAGLALTAAALGWISGAWAQERVDARDGTVGRARRVGAGFVLLAVGIAVVSATLLTRLPMALVPAGWGLAGLGMGLAYSAGGLMCFAAAPRDHEGEVSGQMQLAEAIAIATGCGLGGALMTRLGRAGLAPREAYAALFAVMLVAAISGAAIAHRLARAR
jgi:MFS family permease